MDSFKIYNFEVDQFEVRLLLEEIQGEVHDGRQVPAD